MKTKTELFALINSNFAGSPPITAQQMREVSTQNADSAFNLAETTTQTAAGPLAVPSMTVNGKAPLVGGAVVELLRSANLTSQTPTALGTPLQVVFGAATGTSANPVMLSAAGVLTFNKAGTYAVRVKLQVGRTGSSGVSRFLTRIMKNGAALGVPDATLIESPNQINTKESRVAITVAAGDYIAVQVARDPSGDNSGGLVAFTATGALAAWGVAPSALLVVEQFTGVV